MSYTRSAVFLSAMLSVAGGVFVPLAAHARADVQACDAGFESVLRAAAPLPPAWSDARAAWLDGMRLRWGGSPPGGRFQLLHSARGALALAAGERPRGADAVLELQAVPVPPESASTRRFSHIGAGPVLSVKAADRRRLAALHRGQLMLARLDAGGRVLDATRVQAAGALDALFAAAGRAGDLGATPPRRDAAAPRATRFAVWAPTAQAVSLCLHDRPSAAAAQRLPMRRDERSGIWRGAANSDLSGRSYTYLVDVFVPGRGLVRNRVTDPYSLALTANSQRSIVIDLGAPHTKPAGWDTTPRPVPLRAATDLVIYELHVRDFSVSDETVSAPHRGKYLAFTEDGSRGMRHLKALAAAGMSDVHLLPVFDLATVPERDCTSPDAAALQSAAPDSEQQQRLVMAQAAGDCFNWGYDPLHYTAPEGSFATDPDDGAKRIVEFRRIVQALHRAGLRVGMDVVYNHTSAAGQHPQSVLDRIVPGYYHRLDAKGGVERSTCCDNTATEHLMMARLMIDSAVVWARDHRIDSFRFDLMGHQPRAAMEALQKAVNAAAGREVQLIGEGWNFGEVADGKRFVQAAQLALNGSGIGTFSDRMRDAVRGGSAGDNGEAQVLRQGWISGLHFDANASAAAAGRGTREELLRAADLVRVGLAGTLRSFEMQTHDDRRLALERIDYAGQPAGYASQPAEAVNYVENHDNQTLFDALVFKLPNGPNGTSQEDRARVQHLGNALVAFAQGVAYFHAGQEFLRSKSMDRNSYDSGDWFNRIDWSFSDNHFGTGLPPERDNRESWAWMKPLLAPASMQSIKPTRAEIEWTRDAFLDLLRIRASSTLFRLPTADEVKRRLSFFNTGSAQVPSVVAAHLEGRGLAGAGFAEIAYLVNADKVPQRIVAESLKGRAFQLHPVLAAPAAADKRAAGASFDAASGTFSVPARTAVVFVVR